MEIAKTASLIIYRIREKGLEVFLVNKENENEQWQLPQGEAAQSIALASEERMIALDPVHQADGKVQEGLAIEGDWHDIPSLKSLLFQDALFVKEQIKQMIPDMMEKGTFFAVKEAFKRVMPHQYEMLKELKDILMDRNSVKNL